MTLINTCVFLSPSTNHDIFISPDHLYPSQQSNRWNDTDIGGMTLILGGMTLFSLLLSHVSPSTDGMTLILGGMTLFSLLTLILGGMTLISHGWNDTDIGWNDTVFFIDTDIGWNDTDIGWNDTFLY